MVVPAGLPDAQQLVLVEKHSNGRVTTREILQVRFSQLKNTTDLTPLQHECSPKFQAVSICS